MDRFDSRFQMTPSSAFQPVPITAERATAFLRAVYGWMFVGLGITAAVALAVSGAPGLTQAIFGNPILFFGLVIGELGLVFFLSARVQKMAPSTASALFIAYSALNGATLSSIFVIAAGMVGALALYGSTTKRSLAAVGHIVFMGLIGLVLATVLGMFW